MRKNIRERIPKNLYDDLYNRRVSVKEVAEKLGVGPNYVSFAIPERAPKRNPVLLKATRKLFQNQIAREVLEGKHTVTEAANLACISERTMFRRLKKLKESRQ
jgi:transposase-like protein